MSLQKENIKILIIDDEKPIRDVMSASIKDEGYNVITASDGKQGLEMIQTYKPLIVFCDIWMNDDMEGLNVLKQSRMEYPETEFVMISGHGNIETAVKSTKLGAWDFVEKPLSMDKVLINISNIIQFYQEKQEKSYLLNKLRNNLALVGESQPLVELKKMIAKWAPTSNWILLCGEPGTGKSLVSQIVHYFSDRAARSFVEINMQKVPEELHEAELFGIEAGSFPGVEKNKKGKFELADQGTIVLHELEKVSLALQEKILHFLQNKKFTRSGGAQWVESDVRVIISTDCKPEIAIEKGQLLRDLYYRVNTHTLNVPTLKERIEDLSSLMSHFSDQMVFQSGYAQKLFSQQAIDVMKKYSWPGNVRELRNFIERVYILTPTEDVDVQDLYFAGLQESSSAGGGSGMMNMNTFREARALFEREYLLKKILDNQGNITKTAEMIGLERSYLHRKIKLYNLESEIKGS